MMLGMYDDEYDEEVDVEQQRAENAATERGVNERAFYDGLAKKEDERHNAMRADVKKRSLILGELEQKLRHKKTELHSLELKISQEEDVIFHEGQKAYRVGTDVGADGDKSATPEVIPILTRDIENNAVGGEFSTARAEANIKQLKEEKIVLEKIISEMSATVSEEQRALSQLQHTLLRM